MFRSTRSLLSIIVPCYNEQEVIEQTYFRLVEALEPLAMQLEFVLVNDGSQDATLPILQRLAAVDARVRVVNLSRNFGHQLAVTAGIDAARGDAVVLIDADLQDPPAVILQMVERWRAGFDVAFGRRTARAGESRFKRWTARLFYRLINHVSDVPIPLDAGDFRLMDRRVVEALKQMPERDRFLRGMVSWVGFRQTDVLYERAPRAAGESKYPLRKMLRLAIDGILSFSLAPLKAATLLGLIATSLSLLGGLATLLALLISPVALSGWLLVLLGLFFLGGAQLLCLGILGEYIGRIYQEIKRRPLYFVQEEQAAALDDTAQTDPHRAAA